MQDEEYNKLKIHATILPDSQKWPTGYTHWDRLHVLADECRERVAKAFARMDEVDNNPDLTPEGKAKARAILAENVIAAFHKSKALENVKYAVERQQAYWGKRLEEAIKPATDNGSAVTYAQIRDRICSVDEKSRLSFVLKNIDNVAVVSAVLLAPDFLSGLSAAELNVVRQKLATRVLSPEAAQAKQLTEQAITVAEKGWARAIEVIAQRGGLKPVKAKAA